MRPVDYAALTHRTCSQCKRRLPVPAFHKYTDPTAKLTGWRYYSRCVECNRANCREYGLGNRPKRNDRLRAWRKKNPAAAKQGDRRDRLKYKYGLTEGQVEAMAERQGGKCLICLRAVKLCVDHCHRTGRVRGLLCAHCNTFLGRVDADPAVLDRMRQHIDQPCHADVLLEIANG